jgi:hypothetical protein
MFFRAHTKSTLFFTSIFMPLFSVGQDMSGIWEGEMTHSSCQVAYTFTRVTLNLEHGANDLNGHIRFLPAAIDSFKYACKVNVNTNTLTINYHARNEVYGNRAFGFSHHNTSYRIRLSYSVISGVERLYGFYACTEGGRGKIQFSRPIPGSDTLAASSSAMLAQLRKKQQERKLQQALAQKPVIPDTSTAFVNLLAEESTLEKASRKKMNERQTVITQTIVVPKNEEVDISISDIAIVDNDTISLFADDQLMAHQLHVSDKPIKIHIPKPPKGNTLTLRMVAENLGSIPPNTAMMVVVTRRQRFEVELKSDFKQSSGLLLKWEE